MADDTDERISALWNQIVNWMDGARWENPDKVERVVEDISQGPDKFIDSTLSAKAQYERLKQQYGLKTAGDLDTLLKDTEAQEIDNAQRWLRNTLDERGFDAVIDAYREEGTYDEELAQSLEDLVEFTHPDLVLTEIENYVSNRFGEAGVSTWGADDIDIEDESDRAFNEGYEVAQNEVWRDISRRLGMNVTSKDEFFDAWQRRLDAASGEDVVERRLEIRVKPEVDGQISTFVDGPGDRFYTEFKQPARERWTAELDQERIREAPRSKYLIGYMTVREDEVIEVDLSEGRERFGATAPPEPPGGRAGWQSAHAEYDAADDVAGAWGIQAATQRGEGAVDTRLLVERDPDRDERWRVRVVERDADGEAVASAVESEGIPTREAAFATATRYMDQNEFDPRDALTQTQLVDSLTEVFRGIAGGFEAFMDETSDDTIETATTALERGADPQTADTIASAFEAAEPALIQEALAEEEQAVSDPADRTLARFLDTLPGYDPPSPAFVSEGGDVGRQLTDEEQAAVSRIREVIRTGDASMDRRTFIETITDVLRSGDASQYPRVDQSDLDVLTPEKREELAAVAEEALDTWLRENADMSDFPDVDRTVQQAEDRGTKNRVRKLIRILSPNESEKNNGTFDEDELRELRENATDARDDFLARLRRRLESLQSGGRGERGVGGFSSGQAEPGLSPDDVDEFIEGAGSYQGDRDPSNQVEDESHVSGDRILRDLNIEKKFERLVRDIGWRRKFPHTDWEGYWRLTDAEKKRLWDNDVAGWVRTWVRNGTIDRSMLVNRGFPDRLIPSEEDEQFMSIDQRRERRERDPWNTDDDVDDSELTPGERKVRDAITPDRDDDDDSTDDDDDEGASALGGFFD